LRGEANGPAALDSAGWIAKRHFGRALRRHYIGLDLG
jgi:hypothetical protein